ncbi:MAG: hypothetical protein AAGD23_13440 [Pseudomonadota bacterium]
MIKNLRSLRIPVSLPYAAYWTVASIFIGILLAQSVTRQDTPVDVRPITSVPVQTGKLQSAHLLGEDHEQIEVDPTNAPSVSVRVERDEEIGWNVFVTVENFRFTPEQVNQKGVANEGHAHIYLNGFKLARLYGNAYHLSELPPGEHTVTVTLNSNDHGDFTLDGEIIAASAKIVQPEVQFRAAER